MLRTHICAHCRCAAANDSLSFLQPLAGSDSVRQLHCVPITPLSPADNYLHVRSPHVGSGKTKSKVVKEPENLVKE